MSGKNLSFEQKKNFVENGYAATFNVGLAYPVNVHAKDSREDIMTQYLRAHAPTMEVVDSAGQSHELIVRKEAAYLRTGGSHYPLHENPVIDVELPDGKTHSVNTGTAVVDLGDGTGAKLPPCRNVEGVKKAASELMQDPLYAVLRKDMLSSDETAQKYKGHVTKICKEHGIEDVKEKDGIELPLHEQSRDVAYVTRTVKNVQGLEREVQKIKEDYARERSERENPVATEQDNKMKDAIAGLDSVRMKNSDKAYMMNNPSPVFAHLENNNLPALG